MRVTDCGSPSHWAPSKSGGAESSRTVSTALLLATVLVWPAATLEATTRNRASWSGEPTAGSVYETLVASGIGASSRNHYQDIRRELETLAAKVEFAWIRRAVAKLDEIVEFTQRNIQRTIALDALAIELRG